MHADLVPVQCGKHMESREEAGVFELEEVPRYRLARAPLVQALAQVRFPLVAHLQTLPGIAPLQDRLVDLFPYMEQKQAQEIGLLVGPGGVAATEGQSSITWEFTNDVEGRLLVLGAGSATLSVGPDYVGIDDFAELFIAVLAALAEVERVRRCDRLGVRYVSLAEQPSGDELAWTRWFRSELTGWVGADVIAPGGLVSSLTQTQLVQDPPDDKDDVHALVRNGVVPPGTIVPGVPPVEVAQLSYLLDLDFFVMVPQRFEPESLARQFLAMHGEIDRFFRWTLTPEGCDHFGFEELP